MEPDSIIFPGKLLQTFGHKKLHNPPSFLVSFASFTYIYTHIYMVSLDRAARVRGSP